MVWAVGVKAECVDVNVTDNKHRASKQSYLERDTRLPIRLYAICDAKPPRCRPSIDAGRSVVRRSRKAEDVSVLEIDVKARRSITEILQTMGVKMRI